MALSKSAAKLQKSFQLCKLFDNFFSKKFHKSKLCPLEEMVFLLIINCLGFCFGKLGHKTPFDHLSQNYHRVVVAGARLHASC